MKSNGKVYRESIAVCRNPLPTMGSEKTSSHETRHRPRRRRATTGSPRGPAPSPPECGVHAGRHRVLLPCARQESVDVVKQPQPTVGPGAGDQRCAGALLVTQLAIALAFLLVANPAWGQTPTLVQHYYTGTNSPPRGLTATNYTFRLPNKTLPGNCLIMFLDYPHGVSVSSITDDGLNTWPAAAVTADSGVGSTVTGAYVLPNAASGTRVITVTFTAAVAGVHAVFLEYYNVAISNAVGGTASASHRRVADDLVRHTVPVRRGERESRAPLLDGQRRLRWAARTPPPSRRGRRVAAGRCSAGTSTIRTTPRASPCRPGSPMARTSIRR